MKESNVQRAVMSALRVAFAPSIDITNYHGSPYSTAGTPDLICCFHGLYVAVEIKLPERRAPSGAKLPRTELSAIQSHRVDAVLAAGGQFVCVRSPREAVDFFAAIALTIPRKDAV
jgi:hypothetical protein